MAIVYVRWDRDTLSSRGPMSWIACSPCLGTGSIRDSKDKNWLACPRCYGSGIGDMVYETMVHRG